MFLLRSNQITSVGFKTLLKAIKTNLLELQLLELNISSNNIKIDESYEDFFDFSGFEHLKNLDLNMGYTDISPEFLIIMFKSISAAKNIKTLSINLECTRLIPMYFNRAMRELSPLQKVEDLTINVSNNSIREEGVYALADLCCNMTSLSSLKVYFRNAEVSDKGLT